jgi:hypothetical protein
LVMLAQTPMSTGAPRRDVRIDVWRGLCLVDVVLVHLAYSGLGFPGCVDDLIKHYTRFAAGGFVFLAGLTVAVVFGPRLEHSAAERWQVYCKLWRRAALLVVVDICASMAYRLLDVIRLFPADPATPLPEALLGIVLLQRPGLTGGILLLYSVLLAVTPAVFALHRRRGAWPIVAMSVGLYGLALLSRGAMAWPPYDFPVVYWQPLYFGGFLSAFWYRRTAASRTLNLWLWAAGAGAVFGVIFLAHHGPSLGLPFVAHRLPLDFTKTPLQLGALLWYLSIVQVVLAWTSVVWNRTLAGTPAANWLALLGRHSLLVYTAHVFTELLVMEYVWRSWPPTALRSMLAVADLAMLFTLCVIAEEQLLVRAGQWALQLRLQRARPWQRGLAAVLGVAVLALTFPGGHGGPDRQLADSDVEWEAAPEWPRLDISADESLQGIEIEAPLYFEMPAHPDLSHGGVEEPV